MTFNISRHAQIRMQQRGRKASDIAFILEHGTMTSNGIMLRKKDVADIEHTAREFMERAHRLRGVILPISEDCVKTAFKASDRQQRILLRKS